VDCVIALTHMRWPNDIRLAENVSEIDLILGGHDHDFTVKTVRAAGSLWSLLSNCCTKLNIYEIL